MDVCSSVALKAIHPGNVGVGVAMVRRPTAPEVPWGQRVTLTQLNTHIIWLLLDSCGQTTLNPCPTSR